MSDKRREPAWRIFSGELRECSHQREAREDRAPSHVISPLGALLNRVYIVGAVTAVEQVGKGSDPVWKARIYDPTGPVYVTAGQYQPDAARVLSGIKPPAFIALCGKVRVYRPEEDAFIVTIRPERVWEVDETTRDRWVARTCLDTLERIACVRSMSTMQSPTEEQLMEEGHRRELIEGALLAAEHYGEISWERYMDMVQVALRSIPDTVEEKKEPEEPLWGERVFELIAEMDGEGRGVAYEEVLEAARDRGMGPEKVNAGTSELLDEGRVYEPTVGWLRVVA